LAVQIRYIGLLQAAKAGPVECDVVVSKSSVIPPQSDAHFQK